MLVFNQLKQRFLHVASFFFIVLSFLSINAAESSYSSANISLDELPEVITFNMNGQIVPVDIKTLFAGNNVQAFHYFISSRVIRDALLNKAAQQRNIPIALPIRPDQFQRFVEFCIKLINNDARTAFNMAFDPQKGLSILQDLDFDPLVLSQIQSIALPASFSNINALSEDEDDEEMADYSRSLQKTLRIVLANKEQMVLDKDVLEYLKSIDNTLIANSLSYDTPDNDIITITLPSYATTFSYLELQNFLAAISAIYGYNKKPSDIEKLIALRMYLDNVHAQTIAEINEQLKKLRIYSLFFKYNDFATYITLWRNILGSQEKQIAVLTEVHDTPHLTSIDIIRKIINTEFFNINPQHLTITNLIQLIQQYRRLAYVLNYNFIEQSFNQLIKILSNIEQWSLVLQNKSIGQQPIDKIKALKKEFADNIYKLAQIGERNYPYNKIAATFSNFFKPMLEKNNFGFAISYLEDMKIIFRSKEK